MLACFAGKVKAVELLRENGAKYESRDKGGSTAFHWAIDGQSLETIEWCIEDGWNVNIADSSSHWTPLLRCGLCWPCSPLYSLDQYTNTALSVSLYSCCEWKCRRGSISNKEWCSC